VLAVCGLPCIVRVSMVSSVDVPIRPRKQNVRETTLSLVRMREKNGEEVGLVRMSARLSYMEMKQTIMVLEATLSRTK